METNGFNHPDPASGADLQAILCQMKIATFNVNGVNGRLPVLLRWLAEASPDIVCLQELKAPDDKFPIAAIKKAGYGAIWHGQKSWNGVAILARGVHPVERRRGLPGDAEDIHSRYIEATIGDMVVGCLYLPNGNPAPGPKFDYKLSWFDRLTKYSKKLLASKAPVILAGDYNVMPTDLDVYKAERWIDDALFRPEVRKAFARLTAQGWTDAIRIIAEIAEQHLEPVAAKQVRDLLAIENATTLADFANWADQIRPQHRQTAPWHFVDIPISAPGYDATRDCAGGNCVVAKIEDFVAELRNRSLPEPERLEALKFVIHFVGDLHQPLHASDDDDRGGNEVRVTFGRRRTNLHAVWDTGILAPAVQADERGYALRLVRDITPEKIAAWQAGTTIDWADESHAVAVTTIYGRLPHDAGTLPEAYENAALPLVNEQLERAGVRLAFVLNRTLRE
jgi:exodeoxyribonuclease III